MQSTNNQRGKAMKFGIVITANDPEIVWNAFRLASHASLAGDTVTVFLLAKGVECESLDTEAFNITHEMRAFLGHGGGILACGTCLKLRNSEGSDMCPLSSMKDLYAMIGQSDKVLTF